MKLAHALNEHSLRWVLPRILAIVVAFSLPALAYSAVGWLTESRLFAVTAVEVVGNSSVPRSEVLETAGFARARNILTVDGPGIRDAVEALPWVRSAVVAIDLRERAIRIDVEERTLAAISVGATTLLIDLHGEPIRAWSPRDGLNVPVVVGVPADDPVTMRRVLAIVDAARETQTVAQNPVAEIQLRRAAGFRLILADGFEVRLAPTETIERLAQLDSALRNAPRSAGPPTYALLDSDDARRVVVGYASPLSATNAPEDP